MIVAMQYDRGSKMEIRIAQERDYLQLAEMKLLHAAEDDLDYGENNLLGVDRVVFIEEFVEFLKGCSDYKIFVADEGDIIISAMFVYLIPKVPKPNGKAKYIAYLTNVFTRREYRNQKIGSELLTFIKDYLVEKNCELLFAWPSENSVNWYKKNGFCQENEIFECGLCEE